MRILFALIVITVFCSSCCKCSEGSRTASFRFVNTSGKDLIYGPAKVYDWKNIRFYSIVDTDTIFYATGIYKPFSGNPDSVITVTFNEKGNATGFVSFGNGEVDTLTIKYASGNSIYPVNYNDVKMKTSDTWFTIIKN